MTDEFLMLCVKNDDLDKSAILYERYKKKLFLFFLYKNHNNRELSEDAVQQVFYRLIKYRNSYKAEANFAMWIYGIARNVKHNDFKQQVKMTDAHTNYPTEDTYVPVNDEHAALQQALQLLPEPQREVLVMSKFMGLKYDEIAELHNCTVGVIKTRVFRAMQSLRDVYFKIS